MTKYTRNGQPIVDSLGKIERCPHCGIANPLMIKQWSDIIHGANRVRGQGWGAYACSSCGCVVVACGFPDGKSIDSSSPWRFFPESRVAHEDIPSVARKFLQQAIDTLHAPDAAAVMAGSAVDAMLKNQGYTRGSLYSRIDQAVSDHILTQGMADWAHSVRLGSNRPRHADENEPHVSEDEAKQSVEFAEALGNFLFVLAAKIERGIAAATP
jgi:Domain of unknown function (DUF4145)